MWRGSLRNPAAVAASRWDWGWIAPAFEGTRISIGDVDGLFYSVERGGCILWIECKRVGETYFEGQRRMHTVFSTKPGCSCLLLRGDPDWPVTAQWVVGGAWGEEVSVERDEVVSAVSGWFRDASRSR